MTNADGERFVDVGGQRWRVLQLGGGAPCCLLLHGTGASIHSWRAVAERLAVHATVVVPDLPGHAFTGLASPAQLTLPGMAQAVAALLRTAGVVPDLIAGHSAGAAVAARLVLDGLTSPSALAAVNGAFLPFGGAAAPLFTPLARALYAQRWVPRLFARRAADLAVVRRLVEGTGSRLDDAGIAAYQQLMRQPAHAEAALGMMAHWDLRTLVRDLPRLDVPLWLLVGDRDRAVPPRQAARVAARCARAQVVSLDGLGHLAQEEDPSRVASMLQALAERAGSPQGVGYKAAQRLKRNPMHRTLKELLAAGAGTAHALSAPSRTPLAFDGLRALIEATIARLNALGIGRNDRVAIVVPNGPEMATCFVACASGVTSAPLNPAYRADEFEFYLNDLNAKALIVERGSSSPAVEVAAKLGVRLIELVTTPEMAAGQFTLEPRDGAGGTPAANGGFALPDDVSMVLHTSGTTSRPKIVPLSQANLAASAQHIARTLKFTATDCGLNIMPLFHIHGLIAGVLAPLSAGSQVFCTPGFNALKFFGWMDEARPTWYTAVPTMHQTIISRASKNLDVIARHPLRFMRSSSSSMPPQVIKELEEIFKAPLIESYGMTEATHQMASNPLPPAVRKPGTVGIAAGPEIAIMAEDGALLARGETGEIVIRGPNVTAGYENNPKANAEAFTNGWFRTGDQGVMDADGYVSITGRLKEIINRGGEKVSPREVDEILMDHPAVAQVVCFGMPHPKLGEEVAAAVVLREGQSATERELQTFVSGRAAEYKVPKKILILDEIPKGATGKLQRIGLAAKLGLG